MSQHAIEASQPSPSNNSHDLWLQGCDIISAPGSDQPEVLMARTTGEAVPKMPAIGHMTHLEAPPSVEVTATGLLSVQEELQSEFGSTT